MRYVSNISSQPLIDIGERKVRAVHRVTSRRARKATTIRLNRTSRSGPRPSQWSGARHSAALPTNPC